MKNIIIIVVDAFRIKNLSAFGYEKETDKYLKKIGKESLYFKKHFSNSNSTAPALTSIFTGKLSKKHGIIHQVPYTTDKEFDDFEDNKKFWLPSFLKEKGYDTIAIDWIGLWFKDGFDYYEEKEDKDSQLRRFMKIPKVKRFLLTLPNWAYKFGKKVIKTRASEQFSPTKETMDLAISKIKTAKKPFFLFVHCWDTHFPFPNTKFSPSGKKDSEEIIKKLENNNQKEYIKKRFTDINLESMQDIMDKYDLTIKNIDKEIGRMHKFLKKAKLWEDTVFIVLGDHGTSMGEHNVYFSHSGLYEESIRVPLIMHIPGFEGKEINEMVQNIDIVPTLLEVIGEKTEDELDGKSLIPLIKEGKKIRDKILLVDGLAHNITGVRTETKKLIVAKDKTCHLCKANHHEGTEEYDLVNDPNEQKNIYSGESELMKDLT